MAGDILDIVPALKRKRISRCEHESLEVDDDVASLTCADCGHEIDPWTAIREWAREDEHVRFIIRQARVEAERLRVEIEELTRQRNNLRAQVKRSTRTA